MDITIGLIIAVLIYLAIGALLAFTIMTRILQKSNNLGSANAISDNIIGGFVILPYTDGPGTTSVSNEIHNPVILKKSGASYSTKTFKDMEDEINNADFEGIKWHK